MRVDMPKGVFLNTAKANCSIYESGRMMYESLVLTKQFELDYLEIDEDNRVIPAQYDFYAFNYHYLTMGWLDTKCLSLLPGFKITFVLEVSPNDPFVLCPKDCFDAYCVLDPTVRIDDRRVYAFPRPLENFVSTPPLLESNIPVIGSFGFATPGKGFELVVDAVNKEFDQAIVRINIPPGTYADKAFWKLHKQNYAEYLADLCLKTAKKGIQVIVSHNFMSKSDLIEWCAQNTLNCFLYTRNQPGLSATTDQAISSGRPLAVSSNDTFRHILTYIKPYPCRSLKDSIAESEVEVQRMRQDWSPENFTRKFESVLMDLCVFLNNNPEQLRDNFFELKKKTNDSFSINKFASMIRLVRKKLMAKS